VVQHPVAGELVSVLVFLLKADLQGLALGVRALRGMQHGGAAQFPAFRSEFPTGENREYFDAIRDGDS
jgi:hypothetical protein